MNGLRQSSSAAAWLGDAWRGLTGALYPPACPLCRAETEAAHALCPECWQEAHFLTGPGCARCGQPIEGLGPGAEPTDCDHCRRLQPAWSAGHAALSYEGSGRRLVLALKHGDRLDMVAMLARWMLRSGGAMVETADLIVPVPIHWTRRLKRRANQSAELARAVAKAAGAETKFAPELLRRRRRTATQDGKNRAARAANVADAFAMSGRGHARISGAEVLLIDDVLTTGATLDAVARTLLAAGAARVNVLVIALVLRRETPYLDTLTDESEYGQAEQTP